jgi:integrase/recombinase XerC
VFTKLRQLRGVTMPPLNEATINKIVSERGNAAGVVCKPHGLRHTAITTALDRTNGNVREVAHFSRHKNPATVFIYDDRRLAESNKISSLIEDPVDGDENDGE